MEKDHPNPLATAGTLHVPPDVDEASSQLPVGFVGSVISRKQRIGAPRCPWKSLPKEKVTVTVFAPTGVGPVMGRRNDQEIVGGHGRQLLNWPSATPPTTVSTEVTLAAPTGATDTSTRLAA